MSAVHLTTCEANWYTYQQIPSYQNKYCVKKNVVFDTPKTSCILKICTMNQCNHYIEKSNTTKLLFYIYWYVPYKCKYESRTIHPCCQCDQRTKIFKPRLHNHQMHVISNTHFHNGKALSNRYRGSPMIIGKKGYLLTCLREIGNSRNIYHNLYYRHHLTLLTCDGVTGMDC